MNDNIVAELLKELEGKRGQWGAIRGLAKKYKIPHATVLDIRDGKSYKHVSRQKMVVQPELESGQIANQAIMLPITL